MNISPASISLMRLQSQVLSSLMSPASDDKNNDSWSTLFSLLSSTGVQTGQLFSDPFSILAQNSNMGRSDNTPPSAAGRNEALFGPESAYKMMTVINSKDMYYKAQFSELSQIKSYVFQMQDAGQSLGSTPLSADSGDIKSRLRDFMAQYNAWIHRFDPDLQKGGLLADTRAAHVSQYELEQNINNRFYGIKDGLHGLGDIGVTFDRNTKLASLDTAKLDSALMTNKQGVVSAMQEFGTNFAKSAQLLNSKNNFILNQLDNLDRAIHYIADNKGSLQKEFGIGDTTIPTGQTVRALAAYNLAHRI